MTAVPVLDREGKPSGEYTHQGNVAHKGLELIETVRRELAPYATPSNTDIGGPDVTLRAEAGQAMAMAMVLHELATNAVKYGALATKNGRVSIHWNRSLNGHPESQLVLECRETGGPPVVAAGKASYGTSTIRDLIPRWIPSGPAPARSAMNSRRLSPPAADRLLTSSERTLHRITASQSAQLGDGCCGSS